MRAEEEERERERRERKQREGIHVAAVAEGWRSFGRNFQKPRSGVHLGFREKARACVARKKRERERELAR